MPEARTYHGRCHCGAVQWSATTPLDSMGDCNCSRCSRLGWIMQAVPAGEFELQSGEEKLTLYRFNTHKIDHLFCRDCGIESFGRGTGPDGAETVMINVNCLDDGPVVDRNAITHWDGKSW